MAGTGRGRLRAFTALTTQPYTGAPPSLLPPSSPPALLPLRRRTLPPPPPPELLPPLRMRAAAAAHEKGESLATRWSAVSASHAASVAYARHWLNATLPTIVSPAAPARTASGTAGGSSGGAAAAAVTSAVPDAVRAGAAGLTIVGSVAFSQCRAYATEAAWLAETALHRVARDSPFSWAAAAARMRSGGSSSGGGGGGSVRRRSGSSAGGDDGGSSDGGAPVYGWVVSAVKARKRPRPVPAMTRLMRSLFQLGRSSHDSGGGGGGGGSGDCGDGGGGSSSDTGSGAPDGKRRGKKRRTADRADDAQHDSAENGILTRGLSAPDNGSGSTHRGMANGHSHNGAAAAGVGSADGISEYDAVSTAATAPAASSKKKKKKRSRGGGVKGGAGAGGSEEGVSIAHVVSAGVDDGAADGSTPKRAKRSNETRGAGAGETLAGRCPAGDAQRASTVEVEVDGASAAPAVNGHVKKPKKKRRAA
eukprot:TRINITY_DN4323_c1_g3_i1.p2 TRINITY_DN4323_c1_g3~~TRINITY_DN4323_c1_g3_i1.p2  ORF type:complete len:477 (-),score=177.29 TRINITY_DN4323_c1_g3_i1:75-1505(-)